MAASKKTRRKKVYRCYSYEKMQKIKQDIIKEITELAKTEAVIIEGDHNTRTWEEVRYVVQRERKMFEG